MSKRTPPCVGLVVALVVGAPVAVLLTWPQLVGAQGALVVAQVIAFRVPLTIALLAVAVALAVLAGMRHRWGVAAGLALVFGAAALGNGTVLIARGGGGSLPDGDVTVMAWNTQGGAAAPERIAQLILDTTPDIVSLPETDDGAADAVLRLLAEDGFRMAAFTTYGPTGESGIPTSVLIAEGWGDYRVDHAAGSTPGLPSVVLRPVDGTGPTIVAAHPMPPLPGRMHDWQEGLAWIAAQCDQAGVIIAGDLNATVDHLPWLGDADGCRDAANEAGGAAAGTWPTSVPVWLGAPIDHVLVGSGWTVRGFEVVTDVDGAGSDHRPVIARLRTG